MVDFTQYNPPGVYVQDTTTPLVNSAGVPASAVCLVGAAIGYQTATEIVTLSYVSSAGVPVALAQRGAYLSSTATGTPHHSGAIASPVLTKVSDGSTLVEGTDYSMSLDTTAGGGVANGVAYVTALRSAVNGVAVVVTYNYANANYTAPQLFNNYDDLVSVYGLPLSLTSPSDPNASQVVSPLSLAAQIAFQNGATELLTVALDPTAATLRDAFTAAYAEIASDFRVSTVVPLFVESSVTTASTGLSNVENLANDLANHCTNSTNDGFPRVGLFGTAAGILNSAGNAPAGQADFTALAASVRNKRVLAAYPNVMNLYNGNTNQSIEVDGAYLAAAYAGQLVSDGVQQGLTRKTINGFTGIPARVQKLQTKTFKNALSQAGVAVTEINRQNVLVCRHGVSTDMTSVLTREVSITRQSDALYFLLYDGLDASGLVGSPMTLDTVLNVKGVITGILESAVNNQIIVDYQDALVRQQSLPSGDPTAIQIKFAWLPAVPLNYVIASYAIDLNTGDYADITSSIDLTGSTSV